MKAILLTAALSLTPLFAQAQDRHYMLMFASQATPNVAQRSHTFALFVKAPAEAGKPLESISISWMPATLKIEPLSRDPEPGVNLTLVRTLEWAASVQGEVLMWGPYPIKKDLYDMAAQQAEKLASGKIGYIALDAKVRGKEGTNCIHAVSDIDLTRPLLDTGTKFGKEASEMVLTHFDPYILPSRASNRWLVDQIGLNPAMIKFINPDLTKP